MIDIKVCPYCGCEYRAIIAEQVHGDKYLSLVDNDLNKVRRFWYKCNECNFIYRSPMISPEEASILYSKYRTFEFRKTTPEDYFDRLTSIENTESETYAKAEFVNENVNDVSSILDVGCGGGVFLFQLHKFFPSAYLLGLEPNREYAEMIRKKMNIDVIEDYYKIDNLDKRFDLTVSTDVIEHIHDLNVFWEAAIKNIYRGKYLFIDIPSSDNFERFDISHDVFESPHLYFFSKKHVKNIAKNFGFILIASKQVVQRDVGKDWFIFQKV